MARIKAGLQTELFLGNLDAVRDWGFAPEYVQAMWRMLQHDEPMDYVVGTGTAGSVRQFCAVAFSRVGLDWQRHVRYDDRYERPAEVDALIADASRAQQVLGWRAQTHWTALAELMVDADLQALDDQLAGRLVRIDR